MSLTVRRVLTALSTPSIACNRLTHKPLRPVHLHNHPTMQAITARHHTTKSHTPKQPGSKSSSLSRITPASTKQREEDLLYKIRFILAFCHRMLLRAWQRSQASRTAKQEREPSTLLQHGVAYLFSWCIIYTISMFSTWLNYRTTSGDGPVLDREPGKEQTAEVDGEDSESG